MKIEKRNTDLGPGLPGSFCLGRHGSLELNRKSNVFDFHSLHLHSPRVGRLVQTQLDGEGEKEEEEEEEEEEEV